MMMMMEQNKHKEGCSVSNSMMMEQNKHEGVCSVVLDSMMMMMEQNMHKEICSDDNKLPPLSAKYPWFGVQNLEDLTHQSFSTLHNPLFIYQDQIHELSGKLIRGCFHGWIILSNHPHNNIWSLWNPSSTSNIISLPPLLLKDGDYDSIRECCLSAPPDNPNSVILLTRTNKPTFVFCQVFPKKIKSVRNKPGWTEMSYAYQLKRLTWNGQLLHNLTCCNGHIYALCVDNDITRFVIRIEIVVKRRGILVQLLSFGAVPFSPSHRCPEDLHFLTGSRTELFYITIRFLSKIDKSPGDVFLFKCDTTSINWKELECLKKWDMIGVEELDERLIDFAEDLFTTQQMWEEVKGHKEGIFVVDLAHGYSEFYNSAIGSKLGGYIHIHDKMDKVIYSYHLNSKTIVASPVRFSANKPHVNLGMPTSHMSMWECWLEDDHREAKFTVDSKQLEDEMVVSLITNNEVEVSECHLLDVPFDMLEMIMKFSLGVEYMNFRATCKRCQLAAPVRQWRNQTEIGRLQNYSLASPWLMVVDQVRGVITFTDPLFGDNYFARISQSLIADETICCSRFGWLLFRTKDGCPVFFNPFTNDLRKLPSPFIYISTFCFSDPPTSPACMVVGVSNEHILIHYVAREPTWHKFDLVAASQLRHICFPTFHDKDLYALYMTGELLVFKGLGKEDISWEIFKTEAPRRCSNSPEQYFLVKCDQHLLLVVMGRFGEPIEVFKLNDSTREWEKVNNVGKHMIYICDTTCLCIEARFPEMENKIYLSQLSWENKKIVFYSLETCTFHTFNGRNVQEKLGNVFTTSYLSAHTWIEPSWSDSLIEKSP